MIRSPVLLLLLLGGCTTTSEFYAPQVKSSEKFIVGSCGHRFGMLRREVGPGVVLEVWPYTVLIRLEKGRSVEFRDTSIRYHTSANDEVLNLEIVGISTGVFLFEAERKAYGIQEQHFGPLDKIYGTGRYENVHMAWGEWSPWKDKNDLFRLELASYPEENPNVVVMDLPDLYVNEQLVEIEPIEFKWEKGVGLACVQ